MAKIKRDPNNDFAPQALYLYGTYQEDGTPHFGLFCWYGFNELKTENGPGLGVMICIGNDKPTKDLIRKNGVFSANLVPESMLPLADYYGCVSGRDPQKMSRLPTVERGNVLDVPTIAESPLTFELKVLQEIHLVDASDLFLCEVAGVSEDERLLDESRPFDERIREVAPVLAYGAGGGIYSSIDARYLGKWGEPMANL